MIDFATWLRIQHLHRVEKFTIAQIARAVSLDARTVRRWLDDLRFRTRVREEPAVGRGRATGSIAEAGRDAKSVVLLQVSTALPR